MWNQIKQFDWFELVGWLIVVAVITNGIVGISRTIGSILG